MLGEIIFFHYVFEMVDTLKITLKLFQHFVKFWNKYNTSRKNNFSTLHADFVTKSEFKRKINEIVDYPMAKESKSL